MNEKLVEQYEELKTLVETLQVDVVKNASGNKSAGIRARKTLRELKKLASELVKVSLTADKT
tara:strand:+ start:1751 stop:1936 length:186 start_codon:yes stop_codon:yes gene_type:complete